MKTQYPYLTLTSILLLLSLTITTLSVSLSTVTIPYNDTNIIFHGRYYTDENGLRFDWPCSSIQFCFVNTSKISWVGSDGFGHYKVVVNQKDAKVIVPKKNNKIVIYQNAQSTDINCIKIIKITEDHFGPLGTKKDAIFKGLQLQGNSPTLVKKQNPHKYELQFVGDSITSAFGVMSSRNPICFFRMRHNQDCTESWVAHLSAKLNATYRIQAESGKGVTKNQIGTPGATMSVLYSKTTSNSKPGSYYYQDKYSPDAIIFALGDNDYSNPIKPGDDYFVLTYARLMSRAAQLQSSKKPKIIAICNADSPSIVCQNVKQAVKSFRYSYNDAYYIEVPQGTYIKENKGCIGHLNVKGQIKMADSIYEKVKSILEG